MTDSLNRILASLLLVRQALAFRFLHRWVCLNDRPHPRKAGRRV